MNSVLLEESTLPRKAFDYSRLKNSDFIPVLDFAINQAKEQIELYKKNDEITFEQVIEKLELIDESIDRVSSIFFSLYSAHGPKEMQEISAEFSKKLNDYSNEISMDPVIFSKIKGLYDQKSSLNLSTEQEQVLEKFYKSFVRNGALLAEEDKARLKDINVRLSQLSLEFSDAVLADTNSFLKLIDDPELLKGLPESALEAAEQLANEKGHPGKWAFSLQITSYWPVSQYAENRDFRKQMYQAFTHRAVEGENSNQARIKEIITLRYERAKLLGFSNHAEFVLKERMAQEPQKVMSFLDELYDKAFPVAKVEIQQLTELKNELGQTEPLEPWDVNFYATKLKKKLFAIDDEALRPYFPIEQVIDGVFKVASKLYNIDFIPQKDVAVYHPDVNVYEVVDKDTRDYIGLFYTDFFPRDTKRAGAWMTDLREQGLRKTGVERPHISIVCNFTKPTKTKPSLLTLNEVSTLFHEFGHALHGLLSRCHYRSVSGTSVYWDFVELPSQLMENWVYEKECLDLFARHYKTGELIAEEYVEKIKSMTKFMQGHATVRQLTFAYLDMAWHQSDPQKIDDVIAFEKEVTEKCRLLDNQTGVISCAFSHIFAGGYSAGYYSYKWAEVLDADAFEYFQQKGIFDRDVATSFRKNILERGGSEHPMDLYKKFRGREPQVDALLKRSGLVVN